LYLRVCDTLKNPVILLKSTIFLISKALHKKTFLIPEKSANAKEAALTKSSPRARIFMFAKNPIILFALDFSFNEKQIKNPYALSLYLFQIRASNCAAKGCFILIYSNYIKPFFASVFLPSPFATFKCLLKRLEGVRSCSFKEQFTTKREAQKRSKR